MNRSCRGGFTLIEIMVAMFVFSVLAAGAYTTLNAIVESSRVVGDQMTRVHALQRTLQIISYDFSQLNPRPVRQELASDLSPALLADGRNEYLVQFTRGGLTNPLLLPRSTLQRVAYYLTEDELVRVQWPVLDRTLGTEPAEVVLLDGIESLAIRYLPESGDWTEQWPPTNQPGPGDLRRRPRAVELVLTLEDYGEIRRLFEVNG